MEGCVRSLGPCWSAVAAVVLNDSRAYLQSVRAEAASHLSLRLREEDVRGEGSCRSTCGALPSVQGCVDLCKGADERQLLALDQPIPNTVAYLPTPRMLAAAAAAAEDAAADLSLLHRTLNALQFPPHRPSALELRKVPFDGFTAMLLQTTRYLSWALMNNRTFFPDLRAYQAHVQQLPWCASSRAPALDEGSAAGCVFEPLTSCAAEESTVLSCAETSSKWSALSRQVNSVRIGKFGRAARSEDRASYGPHTPALRRHGGFWFHSQLLQFIFRLRPEIDARFAADRAMISFRSPIIGMHIRHGDKCKLKLMPSPLCSSIRPFMKAAEKLQAMYNVSNIFLATDDERMVDMCRAGGRFNCIAFPDSTRGMNSVRHKMSNNASVALSVIREVDTLAHCDYFIGTIGLSGVSTAAYELLVARRSGKHVPFVSFGSWQWSFDGF